MPDSSDSSSSQDSSLLAQLLMLLRNQQAGGTQGAATPATPNPLTSNPLDGTQTNGGTLSAQKWLNGGPQSIINANGTFSLPMPGLTMPQEDASSGGAQYGKAAVMNENSPQQSANIDSMLQGAQFNQLLQGLLKDRNLFQTAAPAAPQPAPQVASAPPPPPSVPNVQAAYTPPSQAQIPGMQTLAHQVQAGTASPTAITQAGGPLQASTGSGIPQGSMPSTLQFPAQCIPRPADNAGTQNIVNTSGQATGGLGSAAAGAAQIPQNALKAYQRTQQLQANGFSPATRNFSPSSTLNPSVGTTQDLGSVDAAPAMGFGGSNYASGGLDAMTGADAAPLSAGGANYAAGGLDSGADASTGGAGRGSAASIGGSVPGGIQAVGDGNSEGLYTHKIKTHSHHPNATESLLFQSINDWIIK
jgi:hypothetical protein